MMPPMTTLCLNYDIFLLCVNNNITLLNDYLCGDINASDIKKRNVTINTTNIYKTFKNFHS
jgi:hypothetical protein